MPLTLSIRSRRRHIRRWPNRERTTSTTRSARAWRSDPTDESSTPRIRTHAPGYKNANREGPAGVYPGYVARIAVACSTVNYFGNLDPYPNPADDRSILEEVTSYITALIVDSAGTNPGPAGVELVEQSREIAPNITDATADRGFTMKPAFLLDLHKQGINVFMDYPKTVAEKPDPVTLAKGHEVYIHCGTILPADIPPELLTPPEFDKPGRKKQRKQWYTDRARTFRYSLKRKFPGGNMQFRTPIHAGRVTNTPATMASGSYDVPMVKISNTGPSSRKTVMAGRGVAQPLPAHPLLHTGVAQGVPLGASSSRVSQRDAQRGQCPFPRNLQSDGPRSQYLGRSRAGRDRQPGEDRREEAGRRRRLQRR